MEKDTFNVPTMGAKEAAEKEEREIIDAINSFPPETIAMTFFMLVGDVASQRIKDKQELDIVFGMLKSKELHRTAVEIAREGGIEALLEEFATLNTEEILAAIAFDWESADSDSLTREAAAKADKQPEK